MTSIVHTPGNWNTCVLLVAEYYTFFLLGFLRALQFKDTVKYGSILGGFVGLIVTAVAFYMQHEAGNEITAVSAAEKNREHDNSSVKSIGLTGNESQ